MRPKAGVLCAIVLSALSGCASLVNGASQRVQINSNPANAQITIDGKVVGATPNAVWLRRKTEHKVKLEAPGYMPANITLTNDTSGWFWVNCLWTWACPVLMPIDYFSGSMYKLVPDNVNESLMPWPAGIGGPGVTAPPRDPNAVRLNIAVSELAADAVSGSDASVIANLLRGELVKTGAFNVVEKKNMERILAEQAFQQTGCTAQECAVKLGKLLNVQRMIVGSFGKLMDRFFINIRVVNVETGEAVYADEAKGATVDDIEAGIKAMAGRLAARPL